MAKGWVYVISNKAMPGLVKIGFSGGDPELRAQQLAHTGSPYRYVVEFEILVEDAYRLEQAAHRRLSAKREGREWFACSAEEAVAAIKFLAPVFISETYKRVERKSAEARHQREIKENEISERLAEEERTIRNKYSLEFANQFSGWPFWVYWIVGSLVAFACLSTLSLHATDVGRLVMSVVGGAVIGHFLSSWLDSRRRQSREYRLLEKQREEDISAVRSIVSWCPSCGTSLRFDRAKLLLGHPDGIWNCPSCKIEIFPPRF